MSKKTIAVVGATGAQGGGLVRAILRDPESPFKVRALTRNPDSEKAKALADLGARVVQADLDDPATIRKAFDGVYAAFCVTNFWEHMSPEKEIAQAGNMAEAAARTELEHVIWSTLEDTRDRLSLTDDRMPTLMERYKVPHFDAKGHADELFRSKGVPTTFFLTSFYWDNLIHFGMAPQPDEKGDLVFNLPMEDKELPGIAAEDIGGCAYGILKDRSRFLGQTIGVAGEHLTGEQMAAELSRVLGKPVRYNAVPHDVYRSLDFPGAEDMGNMFQYKCDFNQEFCAARNVDESRQLYPGLLTFRQWLEKHKGEIAGA